MFSIGFPEFLPLCPPDRSPPDWGPLISIWGLRVFFRLGSSCSKLLLVPSIEVILEPVGQGILTGFLGPSELMKMEKGIGRFSQLQSASLVS